jgi:excisionase family DNA binding protein
MARPSEKVTHQTSQALLSMSRSVIYEQLRSGRLRSVRQGRARLVPAVAIQQYVELLMKEADVSYDETA